MSQYDSIGSNYDIMKHIFHNRLEQHNIKQATLSLLQHRGPNTKVIDFACGTGHYSSLLLDWGALTVLGVDISRAMIDAATARHSNTPNPRAHFVQGNGTKPRVYHADDAPAFDVATGFWFLNYAKNSEELAAMFSTIAMDLVPDGVFVGCLMHATDDVATHGSAINAHSTFLTGMRHEYGPALESGEGYPIHGVVDPPKDAPAMQRIELDAYYLKKSLFEEAARAAGMKGKIEWRELEFLDEWLGELGID